MKIGDLYRERICVASDVPVNSVWQGDVLIHYGGSSLLYHIEESRPLCSWSA